MLFTFCSNVVKTVVVYVSEISRLSSSHRHVSCAVLTVVFIDCVPLLLSPLTGFSAMFHHLNVVGNRLCSVDNSIVWASVGFSWLQTRSGGVNDGLHTTLTTFHRGHYHLPCCTLTVAVPRLVCGSCERLSYVVCRIYVRCVCEHAGGAMR